MAGSSKSAEAATPMARLSLDPAPATNKKAKSKKAAVVDSWEDESDSDGDSTEDTSSNTTATAAPRSSSNSGGTGVAAPPPTPNTPSYNADSAPWHSAATADSNGGSYSTSEPRRPEKTDAVARRMIASALGVKAPRLTEEQRAYERALREKERKRRELEKEEEQRKAEQAEKAKAAIWDD